MHKLEAMFVTLLALLIVTTLCLFESWSRLSEIKNKQKEYIEIIHLQDSLLYESDNIIFYYNKEFNKKEETAMKKLNLLKKKVDYNGY